ncbi:CamS family sex pheromone protein [Sporosarcina sp. USHLN248]|uniref:CamS family sex pheromone protein n=1 Tax=Sporosarcina sp. USHLN248 TaxID=3081300 RepID=UPI003015F183
MKRLWFMSSLSAVLLLGGCLPSFGPDQEEVIQENEEQLEETVMIPDMQLKEEFYNTVLPFKKSASRGLVVDNIYTKYDMQEAEEGLLRLSALHFDPKNYYFQEGQYIDRKTANAWLARSSVNDAGLNPPSGKEGEDDAPIYLAHIVEQNYLTMTDDKKLRLSGISIGLALNSVYYGADGKETELSDEELQKKGIEMADTIVSRLRAKEGLSDIPIVIGLFKQEKRNSIVPGTYFATAYADKGKSSASGWKEVNEQYVLLPASSSIDNYREINTTFNNFKQDIDEYFPSFVNVIGTAFLKEGQMRSLKIQVPIQFYGTSETIGFTQYMTSLVNKYFSKIDIEVSITSVNGPEALIVKRANEEEPFVHIYGY